ncbi:MAG: hypothetical protein U0457_08960 [Candidatus Sericytochromatia bacterium]
MKKNFIASLIISFSIILPAFADNTTQLIIEKTVDVDRKTGFILYSDLKPYQNKKNDSETRNASKPLKVSLNALKVEDKIYSILEDKSHYDSLVLVKNTDGTEIKRISVGRRALKIVKSENNNNLFVLCGGYFGSVWEINPNTNTVVRKYQTSWNPTDIELSPDGKSFFVTSGKLQRFNTESEIITDYDLPKDAKYFYCVGKINDNTLAFGTMNKDNSQSSYVLNTTGQLEPSSVAITYMPSKEQSFKKASILGSKSDEIFSLYSRGNDYLYIFSMASNKVESIIPLDGKPDDVLMIPQMKKIFVLHRVLGQVSVIDTAWDNNTQYSVIARIRDERLKDPTNALVFEDGKVFMKSEIGQEGNINDDNILTYTSPVVDIAYSRDKELFEYSIIANKRFYLKNSQLFYEMIETKDQVYSRKLKITSLGNTLGGIAMSSDKKVLYISDYVKNKVFAINTFTNQVTNEFSAGEQASELLLKNDKLYVLNKGENTISIIDLKTNSVLNPIKLKVEGTSVSTVKLYDVDFDQIIKVNLPVETKKELILAKSDIY